MCLFRPPAILGSMKCLISNFSVPFIEDRNHLPLDFRYNTLLYDLENTLLSSNHCLII
jgi:hypothetical protein